MQASLRLHGLPRRREKTSFLSEPYAPRIVTRQPCLLWARNLPFLASKGARISRCAVVAGCAVAAPQRRQTQQRINDSEQSAELGWRTDFAAQYCLLEVIGKGSFGTVWLAANRNEPSQQVAVKVVPKSQPGRSHEEVLNCIRREVSLWGSLSGESRYVAQLLGLYEDAGSVYLVQQLCVGGDLSEALKDNPLPESCCAAVMWCVLSAIRDCHARGLALMDVKPANFLLTASLSLSASLESTDCYSAGSGSDIGDAVCCDDRGGSEAARGPGAGAGAGSGMDLSRLRLADQMAAGAGQGSSWPCVVACDFGCSLSYTDIMRGAKRGGSPVFFAPEQFTSQHGLGVDVWAAGVMLYLLLTGRYPFWDCKRSELDPKLPAYQVMMAVCGSPISLSGPEWRGITREVRDLLTQLLDRNPATRISAEQALEHPWFARWMRASSGGAAPPPAAARRSPRASPPPPPPLRQQQQQQRRGMGEESTAHGAGLDAPPQPCCGAAATDSGAWEPSPPACCDAGGNVLPVRPGFRGTAWSSAAAGNARAAASAAAAADGRGHAKAQFLASDDDEPVAMCYAD